MIDQMHMNDFGKFYYSSRAFLDGRDMYAQSPATDLGFDRAPGLQLLNMNPPHFHLLVLPLARLAPEAAITVWIAVSLFALALSILLIAREIGFEWTPGRILLVAAGSLAFAATQAFFGTGQLSLLLLLAMTACWMAARRGHWIAAAVWLGVCLSVKPFLLIVLPYFAFTRRFVPLAVALVTAAGCFALGLVVFGIDAHVAWYRALAQSADWAWEPMNASLFGVLRRAFGPSPYYAAFGQHRLTIVWLALAGAVAVVSLAAAAIDRTPRAIDRAFALLLVAAQLVSPLGWIYYLWLPAGPVAALVADAAAADQRRRAQAAVAIAAVVGLLWPIIGLYWWQPSPWATVTVGSMYFWATLSAWIWVLLDQAHGTMETA